MNLQHWFPDLDISDFNPRVLRSWRDLVNKIPEVPHLVCVLESVSSCLLVRKSLSIGNPLLAFIIGVCMATFADNCFSILYGKKLAIFESNWRVPIFAISFLLFNFSPLDIVFKIFWFFSPFVALVEGYLAGQTLTAGIDIATNMYPRNWVLVIVIGVCMGAGKYIIVYVVGKIFNSERKLRSPGPVIFLASVGALTYYWFTDLGHISNHFWCDKEEMRFHVVLFMIFAMFIRLCMSDSVFTKGWNMVGDIIGWLIPYYGKTWTPLSVDRNKMADETGRTDDDGNQTEEHNNATAVVEEAQH